MSNYINQDIGLELSEMTREELEFHIIDQRISDFIGRHALLGWDEKDHFGMGQRFPHLGDCIPHLSWARRSIHVAYTGSSNVIVRYAHSWPSYPCRLLSRTEYREVMRHLTVAMRLESDRSLDTQTRQDQIDVQFRRLFGTIQQLRVAGG